MALKVKLLGIEALPKNSYQKAGSKEKEEYDGVWPIDDPAPVEGIARQRASL